MNESIYKQLVKITEEEQRILEGQSEIEEQIYMDAHRAEIDAGRLLESGQLIQIRPHTRFIHFPAHTHNYIEMIYMYSGETKHLVDGTMIRLKQGELLFLGKNNIHEVLPAGEQDIAVNFILMPEFFDHILRMIGEEENLVRDYLVDCLRRDGIRSAFLHFRSAGILQVQNLVENLIWSIMSKQTSSDTINQMTMGLLFLELMNHLDEVEWNELPETQKIIMEVLDYVDSNYRDGKLSELAESLNYSVHWLSKVIKKNIGKTYTELIQEKRLSHAAYLLKTTQMRVIDIGFVVGYENISYFHRIFQQEYHKSPREYRIEIK